MGGRVAVITIFCHHVSIFLMNGMGAYRPECCTVYKYGIFQYFNELPGLGGVGGTFMPLSTINLSKPFFIASYF
jgi:hypothetical protein